MKHIINRKNNRQDEGAALIGVILALLVVTIIGIGITMLGMVNVTVGTNERQSSEAFYLADAGIAQGRRLVRARAGGNLDLLLQSGNGVACDGDELAAAPPPPLPADDAIVSAGAGGEQFPPSGRFTVSVCDDNDGDGNLNTDNNDRLRLVSTGFGRDNSTATVELLISASPMPAIVVDGNLRLNGNPRVMGDAGAVHSNGTLELPGTPCTEEYYSSSGGISGDGVGGAGCSSGGSDYRPGSDPITVPDVLPGAVAPMPGAADPRCNTAAAVVPPNLPCYILRNNGQTINAYTGLVVARPAGWVYLGAAPGNSVQYDVTDALAPGNYHVEGNVKIGANPGTLANPRRVSLLVEGSLEMGGNPTLQPTGQMTLPGGPPVSILVRDDLKLNGNAGTALNGVYYAGDQLQISGNGIINGQIIAKNRDDNPSPPGFNQVPRLSGGFIEISGNPTINYDGAAGMMTVTMNSWRECRGPNPATPCN